MKNPLLLLAALALTGCAHAHYKADFLDVYANLDCGALEDDLAIARSNLEILSDKDSRARYLEQITANNVYVDAIQSRVTVYASVDLMGPTPSFIHKERMRNHAAIEAIESLSKSKGCVNRNDPTPT